MYIDNETIRKVCLDAGANLVGVASVDRFDGVVPEGHPLSIFPYAKSVIVLGFMIPRGALRGVEETTAWQTMSANDPIHPLIQVETTFRVMRWLEDRGQEAVPLYHHPEELRSQGLPVSKDKPAPDVLLNFDYAAYVAGLGTVGKGKFFLTPEYGPRQIFDIVLTDAEIEPNEIFKGSFCDGCDACMKACPAHAYSESEMNSMIANGDVLKWQALHIESCQVCRTGAATNPYLASAEPRRLGAACGRACVVHLEEIKALKYQYVNPFRKNQGGEQ